MGLTDSRGRRISYLRLSVTDRCNFRCRYCMPAEGIRKLAHTEILRFEELDRIARQAVALGIEKIRVTGGEPLVRRGVIEFLRGLSSIAGLRETVLTTNGALLAPMAAALREAGVQRLNVSLDSLQPETFAAITRGGDLRQVLDGIAAAEAAGFPPVKINVVVLRGVNDGEVLDFAERTLREPRTVRFIEYMPAASGSTFDAAFTPLGPASLTVSGSEILERIAARYTLQPLDEPGSGGPARNFRIQGAAGKLGIITPVSHDFCDSCNRIRVTSTGIAKGCLFSEQGIDLRPALAAGDDVLREVLRRLVTEKPEGYRQQLPGAPFSMSQVGG